MALCREFEKDIAAFMTKQDKNKAIYFAKSGLAKVSTNPIISIRYCRLVSNENRLLEHVGQISSRNGIKNYAKTFHKNIYVKDRRKE